ncbi:MAG: glucose-1-phosphate adenylyltransferase subunit GlgD [Clostridia bacterium]|nr:glucose-1-phosphate adenylyltransferase subunit GlgD [Clostridia bacterium]
MSAVGIIFSNIHDRNISELTRVRTMASIPYGCRYRLIDFALSNMVNAGIGTINVITHYNYQSLMDHIGSGKDWDMARRSGGIKILPPYISAFANNQNELYHTRLEALKSINHFIQGMAEDYVVMADCDVICNIDLQDLINDHVESGADITFAVQKKVLSKEAARRNTIMTVDEAGRITDIKSKPNTFEGEADMCLNIFVCTRRYLQQMVLDAIAHDYKSMTKDILMRTLRQCNYRAYRFEGYSAEISSIEEYFTHSMELISDKEKYDSLFNVEERPVFTKVRNSPPTYYSETSDVKNSLIADGCIIDGTVENCILFRGVKVGKGAVVKNSVLFQDTFVGDNVSLNCVVSDKNVVIHEGVTLSGAPTLPFYLEKRKMI